jgi:thiamine biosynthesis protein ThiS
MRRGEHGNPVERQGAGRGGSQLLDELKLQALRVAVQVNTDIVKRERYGAVVLQAGDTVEVLTFMSGG